MLAQTTHPRCANLWRTAFPEHLENRRFQRRNQSGHLQIEDALSDTRGGAGLLPIQAHRRVHENGGIGPVVASNVARCSPEGAVSGRKEKGRATF